MSRAQQLIEKLNEVIELPIPEEIYRAWNQRFAYLGIDNIQVDYVDVDPSGAILVGFKQLTGDEFGLLFTVEDGHVEAIVVDDETDLESDEEVFVANLSSLIPSITYVAGTAFPNLTDLSWLDKYSAEAILMLPSCSDEDYWHCPDIDAYGYKHERVATVIKGGKKVKKQIARKKKKILTPKQKAGFKKAALKRKAKKGQINRARAKSMKKRKQLGLKKTKLRPGEKIKR